MIDSNWTSSRLFMNLRKTMINHQEKQQNQSSTEEFIEFKGRLLNSRKQ